MAAANTNPKVMEMQKSIEADVSEIKKIESGIIDLWLSYFRVH